MKKQTNEENLSEWRRKHLQEAHAQIVILLAKNAGFNDATRDKLWVIKNLIEDIIISQEKYPNAWAWFNLWERMTK